MSMKTDYRGSVYRSKDVPCGPLKSSLTSCGKATGRQPHCRPVYRELQSRDALKSISYRQFRQVAPRGKGKGVPGPDHALNALRTDTVAKKQAVQPEDAQQPLRVSVPQ